ncbi:hypothetical protein AYO20_08414 [Fonsecaea nubica]|uniref:Uncharacterized protein n=1 Tax=Fonsecaea nubica TaxID=856822 RepID=A0A178CPH0_9EURO|nr:hypothetical protein AYO20_08414 [Fonsecaea nubica]OAL31083.1 hypothetical protein AYO20_08414 [Fonsecaea nubica]
MAQVHYLGTYPPFMLPAPYQIVYLEHPQTVKQHPVGSSYPSVLRVNAFQQYPTSTVIQSAHSASQPRPVETPYSTTQLTPKIPPPTSPQPPTREEVRQIFAEPSLSVDVQPVLTQIKTVNGHIVKNALDDASKSLSHVTKLVFEHAKSDSRFQFSKAGNGLDDHNMNIMMDLWGNLNLSWLVLLQRQRDLMDAKMGKCPKGVDPGAGNPQILSLKDLEKLINDLAKSIDPLENMGLVDYQRGIWEEEIIDMALKCFRHEYYNSEGV